MRQINAPSPYCPNHHLLPIIAFSRINTENYWLDGIGIYQSYSKIVILNKGIK
jgi:hypothetical protein